MQTIQKYLSCQYDFYNVCTYNLWDLNSNKYIENYQKQPIMQENLNLFLKMCNKNHKTIIKYVVVCSNL